MNDKRAIILSTVIAIILINLFLVMVQAEKKNEFGFYWSPFQQKIKEISNQFGVAIIADPTLNGPIPDEIRNDSVEAALKSLLAPAGYSYTKVDNYYLVNGPEPPATVMAATESTMVPVGFLDSSTKDKLQEFKPYLTYDDSIGVAYIKAPSSQMKQILAKLYELTKNSQQLSIAYNLQIIDLGNSADLDSMFSSFKYDSSRPDNKLWVITPEEWSIDSRAEIIARQKAESNLDSVVREPWLITLPGKPVKLTTGIRSIQDDVDVNRYFSLEIMPIKLDESTGEVTSNVRIERNTSDHSTLSDNNVKEIRDQVNKVTTTVHTIPGKRMIVAVVRQVNVERIKRWFVFGGTNVAKVRDYMVLMSVTPINTQLFFKSSPLVPIASLNGLEPFVPEPESGFEPKRSFIFGFQNAENDNETHGWIHFASTIGEQGILDLDYRKDNLYSAGYSYYLDSERELSIELLAGKGIGPDDQSAAMIGLGDVTRPFRYLHFFGKYYPWAYLYDSEENNQDGVLEAGAKLGNSKASVTLSALGDPEFDGWRLKIDLNIRRYLFNVEVNTAEKDPSLYFGVGFNF